MKKILCLAFISALTAMAIISVNSVYAQSAAIQEVQASVLNRNKAAVYCKFDSPKEIYYTPTELIISVTGGYESYSGNLTFTKSDAEDFAYIGLNIYLSHGNIIYGSKKVEGNYTAISSYENVLYAKNGKNIDKFIMEEGALVKSDEVITSQREIGLIAAANEGCYYTTVGESTIYFNGDNNIFHKIGDAINDIAFNESVYVLTPSKVICYYDNIDFKSYNVKKAKSVCVGDNIYTLTEYGSVECISLDMSESKTIIASESTADWFYTQPISGDTRLGKIYVVDHAIDDERISGRVAVIDGNDITYLTDLKLPVAVAADNDDTVYVAHSGNNVAVFKNGKKISDAEAATDNIIDLCVDNENKLYILTATGNVIADGEIVKSGVKAFEYSNSWHYMFEDYIDDVEIKATDFCVDVMGNLFCITDKNVVASVIDGKKTEYTVQNAVDLVGITISKVENEYIKYGDILLFDEFNQCVFILDGESIGSANVKNMFTAPELSSSPNERSEGIVGQTLKTSYIFALPIEGQITRTIEPGENVIICKDIPSPEPYIYCIIDDVANDSLSGGYIYYENLKILPYVSPKNGEAKVNIDNTPVYKYPSVHSPVVGKFEKGKLVSIMSFAYTEDSDETGERWYSDAYQNKWRRIAYGDKEGFILNSDLNVEFFVNVELPKTNATIIKNTKIFRYDEETNSYVEFDAIGSEISKDTRVMVDIPFDTSREYTKVVFYRENYGTIDVDCFVRTEDIKFDGVDIIKIIAAAVIIVAVIALIAIIVHKRKNSHRTPKRQIEE